MEARRPVEGGEHLRGSEVLAPARPKRHWQRGDFQTAPPVALAQPAVVFVSPDDIDGDPYNIRETLPSIDRLGWSIYQYGLLENLVVVEHPSPASGKKFQLRAGSRRFEAIRKLRTEGVPPPPGHPDRKDGVLWRWPLDRQIPVLILGSDGHNEHLVENIERSSPDPWEIGLRLHEALCAGLSSREIGTRLGRSNGWVTRYAHIGRGLSPELIAVIKKERVELKLGELARLATLVDEFGDPDGPRQIAAFRERRARRRKRPQRLDPESYLATRKRLSYLRTEMPIPQFIRPIVEAVLDYVEGGGKPGFKQLQGKLFEQLRLSGGIEAETEGAS